MRKNGFFAMMTRMRNITRWGLMRNNCTENLTEHSYDTAVTAHALAVIGKEKFGRDIDPGQIAAVALFHDASEIITGDMPTPVKYNNPELYRYVKAADKISAYIKCVEELRGGNDEFRRAAIQTREAIAKMHLPEADYYMEQFAPAFSLSLDELQEEEPQ